MVVNVNSLVKISWEPVSQMHCTLGYLLVRLMLNEIPKSYLTRGT